MDNKVFELYAVLQSRLEEAENEDTDAVKKALNCIGITQRSIAELKSFISEYAFKDRDDEIAYYKDVFPRFYKHLIYYVRLRPIALGMPANNREEIIQFVRQEMNKIDEYLRDHREFYSYYRGGATFMDGVFFTKNIEDPILVDEYTGIMDSHLCVTSSFLLARLQASELLKAWLQQMIAPAPPAGTGLPLPVKKLKWTGDRIWLAELIYGINESGAIDNPGKKIKPLADLFGYMFDMNMEDIYKMWDRILLRKKSRTVYTHMILRGLDRKMDFDDEHAL